LGASGQAQERYGCDRGDATTGKFATGKLI
jgi:hypothetical protein